MAQLQYLKPRIRGLGVSMDQQVGGINAGKGPGETASQLLVRQLDKRLSQLLKSAQKLKKIGATQRQGRKACRQISLVGYTNAGKTSLMNMLTHAELSARDMPFETLDTTTRVLSRQAGLEILLSDTVGFIRDLPTALLGSFESTLAQVGEADLMLVVIDLSDPEWMLHLETTRSILEKLSLLALPIHYVLNKVDLLTSAECDQRCVRFSQLMPDAVFLCVNTQCPVSVGNLKRKVIERVTCTRKRTRLFVHHGASKVLAEIYAQCTIVAQEANAEGTLFIVDAERAVLNRLRKRLKDVH